MHITPRLSAALALAFVASLATPLARADTPPPPPATSDMPATQAARHGHRDMLLFQQLDLSAEQSASLRSLMKQRHQQARPGMEAIRQKRAALDAATPGTPAYQAAAQDLAQAEASAAHDRALAEADFRAKLRTLLTPDQRSKLKVLRAQHKAQLRQARPDTTAAPASDDDAAQ